ncbi:nucleotide-binding universal stress UspA family protein [Saccharothrix ecbatanensis]|uniref:Nucleotide-binding universal stress UspA family protein n=1 Tax=Saccharothrix ecbatanensis TaxID=1105145 RepID=A0A7W9LYZ7_9PSEU|nr:universal stress protein [Saccharothrix ecbatanensis]MBB5801177.1 nucleotide-binding universal stress UspA family protein [Saccharothrix ecbatanensis]
MTWTKRTVVGVDASPAGTVALEWAVRHAEGGTVLAVSVCRIYPEVCGGDDALHAAQRRVLREAVTRLGTTWGARIQEAVVDGEAGPALVGLAEDADVLVLGGHHYHRAGAAAIGSVVSYCVRYAKCPVVVVPVEGNDDAASTGPCALAGHLRKGPVAAPSTDLHDAPEVPAR